MTPPKTTQQKVFHLLLKSEIGLSERNLSLNGFRSRINEIRNILLSQGIILHYRWHSFKNEFGHAGQYKQHFIESKDKKKAEKVYETLVKR
jgi:hypothetical protein